MNSVKLIKQLKADGFVEISVRSGHHKLRDELTGCAVIVPHPKKELPMGTVQSIFRQAGWRK
jgi:predicted RNA binding protein YcfA (HicA-like mRNA interferase family)